jgi:hypothetical protein
MGWAGLAHLLVGGLKLVLRFWRADSHFCKSLNEVSVSAGWMFAGSLPGCPTSHALPSQPPQTDSDFSKTVAKS